MSTAQRTSNKKRTAMGNESSNLSEEIELTPAANEISMISLNSSCSSNISSASKDIGGCFEDEFFVKGDKPSDPPKKVKCSFSQEDFNEEEAFMKKKEAVEASKKEQFELTEEELKQEQTEACAHKLEVIASKSLSVQSASNENKKKDSKTKVTNVDLTVIMFETLIVASFFANAFPLKSFLKGENEICKTSNPFGPGWAFYKTNDSIANFCRQHALSEDLGFKLTKYGSWIIPSVHANSDTQKSISENVSKLLTILKNKVHGSHDDVNNATFQITFTKHHAKENLVACLLKMTKIAMEE